jgi:DnaJ-class molecular chaperone
MAERWWVEICPECNGRIAGGVATHNETCPNRTAGYVARDVEVMPVAEHQAALACDECRGGGMVPSGIEHFGAVEMMGCEDCQGTGSKLEGETRRADGWLRRSEAIAYALQVSISMLDKDELESMVSTLREHGHVEAAQAVKSACYQVTLDIESYTDDEVRL